MIGLCGMDSLRIVLLAVPWSAVIGNGLVILVGLAILGAMLRGMRASFKNKLKARKAKEREAKRRRDLLEESVRSHLLPALIKQGFETAPPAVHCGRIDRDFLRCFPSWGKVIRAREPVVDMVEIQFSTYGRAAFRINACAVPKEGMMTAGGQKTAEECIALGVHDLEMLAWPRWFIFFSLFSQRLWRFRSPMQSDYEKLALLVAGYLPELELTLREGKLGPHMRRLDSSLFKPRPPEVLERIDKLKSERN
jgi:hypothetical protein